MSYFKNVVLQGTNDAGNVVNIPVTAEGHVETAIHGPRNPFGSIHVENLTPIFQLDAIYGINNALVTATTGLGGSLYEQDAQFVLQTNTTVGGNSTLQSKRRLRYRPGQGIVSRFTALFSTGVANSFQVVGVGHPEDGLYVGYSGVNFGFLHSRAGIREVQTLDIMTGATSAGAVNVTLNGANHIVQVSNSSNGYRTAYDISTGIYTGWSAQSIGSGVIFLANSVNDKTQPFLFSGLSTSAGGTFSKTRSGQSLIEDWFLQPNWSNDKMDGTGPSSTTLDPLKGNVYQIGYQFLGYGALTLAIEASPQGNNPDFVNVHTINYPNNNIVPSFRNPAFPFTASAYSFGSTTNLKLKTSSCVGFIEGQKKLLGPAFSYENNSTAVTTTYLPLFTVKNNLTFKGKSNQCVINILNVNGAGKHANNVMQFFMIRNASLGGNVNFQNKSNDSCSSVDIAATSIVFNSEDILFSFSLAESTQGSFDLSNLGFDLQPGESLSIVARTVAGTAAFMVASLNTREDQ